MADIELTEDLLGGVVRKGDCGIIESDNPNGTVNIIITRRDCEPLPQRIPVPLVRKNQLTDCHCAD